MLDLKQTDTEKHKELTGRTNENMLDMAKYLSDIGKDMWIRRVLVPDLTLRMIIVGQLFLDIMHFIMIDK
jgi:pyruvate-formate lyase-activating enzyme